MSIFSESKVSLLYASSVSNNIKPYSLDKIRILALEENKLFSLYNGKL